MIFIFPLIIGVSFMIYYHLNTKAKQSVKSVFTWN